MKLPITMSEAYLIIAAINLLLELLIKAQERFKQNTELTPEKEAELDKQINEVLEKIKAIQYPA